MTKQTRQFGKVAVLMGGVSAEREISLRSGQAVLDALVRQGVDAYAVDPGTDVIAGLQNEGFDRAFIILHGRGGEDGTLQGALEIAGIPYTGSGVVGSAVGMDKHLCKLLWRGLGLATPDFVTLNAEEQLPQAQSLGFPLMLKPVHEGSSIGMTKVTNREELEQGWRLARDYDSQVLAERWMVGAEYTCAILGGEALPVIRLETPRTFYDFEAKYQADSTQYICPCGLSPEAERKMQDLAVRAFHSVGASGWGRVDVMMDAGQQPQLLEINTVPGMTDHSLVPMAAKAQGIEFDQLVWQILETSF